MEESSIIRPGIITRNGDTYYPTGDEWLLAFALNGCAWAIEAVEAKRMRIESDWLDSMRHGASD